jgi:HD-GYP domain-containing protein (c-di-GMP phosphodiesterase class II)
MSAIDGEGVDEIQFVARLQQAIQVARLHELENVALFDPINELQQSIEAAITMNGSATLRPEVEADILFFDGRPVKAKRQSFAVVESLVKIFDQLGIGEMRFLKRLTTDQVRTFLRVIREKCEGGDPVATCKKLQEGLSENGFRGSLDILTQAQVASKAVEKSVQVDEILLVRLAYARTLALLREYYKHLRDAELQRYFWRKLVRAVQGLLSLANSDKAKPQLLALTLVKEADDRTFNHATNTCILAILLGQRAELPKPALVNIGLSALLSGIGRFRTDPSLFERPDDGWDDDDRKEWGRRHARALGAFLESRRFDDQQLLSALGVVEHDLDGKEQELRSGLDPHGDEDIELRWTAHPISRIVSVAEAYDDLTTPGSFQAPLLPDEALTLLLQGQPRPFDPVVLALLVNLLGLYPPGTAVLLDTGAIGVVVHPNPDQASRPVIAIVRDAQGENVDGDIVDLAARSPEGNYPARIARSINPKDYGITVPEYLRG